MWKVIWNYRGRHGGEKMFKNGKSAKYFAHMMIKKGGITRVNVEFVG